jgi:hypothetical protein
MNLIYLDNFRGFSNCIVPLKDVNFFVGENSTGKSSFLSLVYLLSNHRFWFSQDFEVADCCDLGGFRDIVSTASKSKSQFVIGLIDIEDKVKLKSICNFTLMSFKNKDGVPVLRRYIRNQDNKLMVFAYQQKKTRYKILEYEQSPRSIKDNLNHMKSVLDEELSSQKGLRDLPHEKLNNAPVSFIISFLQSTDKKIRSGEFKFSFTVPFNTDITWFAPIRTKPKRTYDGFKLNFSPEGDHTPYILKKAISTKERGIKFASLLSKFGESSGLFKSVDAHSFGKDPSAPFEVQVRLAERPINISNVGYGVSQVLPLVVDMLIRPKGHIFAIQQPEVHLHPKAQAALGEMIHFLATEEKHRYYIETHSDYLIDRFRLGVKNSKNLIHSQVLFFERVGMYNKQYSLPIDADGKYPVKQPKNFRNFFINEEIQLLEL